MAKNRSNDNGNRENHRLERVRKEADELGYELRRKGRPASHEQTYGADGKPLKVSHMPHYTLTKMARSRLKKVTHDAKKVFGYGSKESGEVWSDKLTLCLEHVIRWLKNDIKEDEMRRSILRLLNPLKREEYLPRSRKAAKK